MTNPVFDDQDQEILDTCCHERDKQDGPRIGDFVEMPDGRTMRFSHDWDDEIQISKISSGAYYLFQCGGVSMSGGLEPAIDKCKLTDTGRDEPGSFWFFHHGRAGAGRGVYFKAPCRVFKYEGEFTPSTWVDSITNKPGAPSYF